MTVMRVGLEVDLPAESDDGGVTLADGEGGFVYLRGTASGQTLVWNEATGTWEVSGAEITIVRRLLEEILVRLDGAAGQPATRDTQILADWATAVLQ